MAGYRLCQLKKAEHPYYIENISIGVFSMEELCYYICNNLYLLDETVFNEGLADWLSGELGLTGLAQRFRQLLENGAEKSAFVIPILREIQYLSQSESKELQARLKRVEEQPVQILNKLKGDALVEYGKYQNAARVYEKVLRDAAKDSPGEQFLGSVWHNIGCAKARMFQFEDAEECFEKAYSLLHTKAALKSYLSCVYLGRSRTEFLQKGQELGTDAATMEELEIRLADDSQNEEAEKRKAFQFALQEKENGNHEAFYQSVDGLLDEMMEEYHKNTGY